MFWRKLHTGLLAGVLLTGTALPVRADHHGHHHSASAAGGSADCGPAYRTVHVQEWVPEQYQTTRTTYRTEWKEETYTAHRTETVPETRTRTVTVNKMVPETRMETRVRCVNVPSVEERTVMQTRVSMKQVTEMTTRRVDRGHWECREVPVSNGGGHLLGRLFHRSHKSSCGDDCCAPCTKTVRCWVPNWVCEQVPVTRCVRVCEQVPCTIKVNVCRVERREEQVQVTVMKCVPETRTETYTAHVCRSMPYQATRKVAVCVPHTEKVTCTRMVCRTVAKQVPCEPACCETTCCKPRHRLFGGLFSGHHGRGGSGCCD